MNLHVISKNTPPESHSSPIPYPSLCARCGSPQAVAKWETTGASAKISPWTLLTVFVGAIAVNQQNYRFTVPVCAACRKKLYEIEAQTKTILTTSAVLGAILGIILVRLTFPGLDLVTLLLAGIMFGAVLGFILGAIVVVFFKKANNYYIGYYNGELLVFYNKEFQAAVTALEAQMDKAKWVKRESPKLLWKTKDN
jgi:hypothetical protein